MSSIQIGRLHIAFGALCDPLRKQVSNVGLRLDPGQVDFLQGQADAIVKLKVSGTLTDGEAHKVRQRLMKKICAAVTGEQS